jgi:hypothetical protein
MKLELHLVLTVFYTSGPCAGKCTQKTKKVMLSGRVQLQDTSFHACIVAVIEIYMARQLDPICFS